VATKILRYSYVMVATTLLLIPYAGLIYGACAAVLGGWFLREAHQLRGRIAAGAGAGARARADSDSSSGTGPGSAPMRLFHLSIVYLTLLFAAVAVTALLPR